MVEKRVEQIGFLKLIKDSKDGQSILPNIIL